MGGWVWWGWGGRLWMPKRQRGQVPRRQQGQGAAAAAHAAASFGEELPQRLRPLGSRRHPPLINLPNKTPSASSCAPPKWVANPPSTQSEMGLTAVAGRGTAASSSMAVSSTLSCLHACMVAGPKCSCLLGLSSGCSSVAVGAAVKRAGPKQREGRV